MVSRTAGGSVLKAARFWLRDVWGPGWDPDRRRLLVQHYLSYARHPAVPPQHTPAPDAPFDDEVRQFASDYLAYVSSLQRTSTERRQVRLTYRPIGKNLRLLATAIRRNADAGVATDIHPDGPAVEVRALERRGHRWQPWLWSRDPEAGDITADQAWRVLFAGPECLAEPDTPQPLPRWIGRGSGAFPSQQLRRVITLAVATGYACQPVPLLARCADEAARAIGWPPRETPVLGLHVRRGDGASSDLGPPRLSNRIAFSIAQYLEAADRLCDAYGIRHIFLATESRVEIERAARLRPHYTFLTVPHDRTLFPDIAETTRYIEEIALDHPERALPLARSAIIDLQLFARCHAFVGAFNSEFSMLAWLMCVAGRRAVVPFVSLSEPDQRWRLHPYDALLNLRNNCPLELYHW
ncbi:MAG TPA: hypothetical protein VEC39_14175 [Vicinamibacterales bacterium]|nr:hypothetical protein [Vicinamibacterales bacterium]